LTKGFDVCQVNPRPVLFDQLHLLAGHRHATNRWKPDAIDTLFLAE
jgi:hypothetical protein